MTAPLREVDIAWLAGLFEGEGCMETGKNGLTRLSIVMTDRDVLDRVQALVPCNGITARRNSSGNPHHKIQYQWRLSGHARVKEILTLLLPWFGDRRTARAREVLDHIARSPGVGTHLRRDELCKNGHEVTEANTVWRTERRNGKEKRYRRCRPCAQAAEKRYLERRAPQP